MERSDPESEASNCGVKRGTQNRGEHLTKKAEKGIEKKIGVCGTKSSAPISAQLLSGSCCQGCHT